ncbi:MAG: FAD-dependent oxidoreductase [Alphaproteobacteria bacterium]|nr:FAD-dependent oxidoreductase [Alphaproteobacteria bacterium]MBL0717969.1 FAD-dependent oxidoreductase [Alphaproteobacteria bacterium]
MKKHIVIIGSGPAGLSSALYSIRGGHTVSLLTGNNFGGQLSSITDLGNYPGVENVSSGVELAKIMRKQSEDLGTKFITDSMTKIEQLDGVFKVFLADDSFLKCDSVILAMGVLPRKLGLADEENLTGRGISYCSVCDGFFYQKKPVAVIGGGNSAISDALYLSRQCSQVYIVIRKSHWAKNVEQILIDKVDNTKNIKVLFETSPHNFLKDENGIVGLSIKDNRNNSIEDLQVDGIFVAIGHIPNTENVKKFIDCDEDGFIKTVIGSTQTDKNGIFCAGDIRSKTYAQVIIACGLGAQSAIECDEFLQTL